MMRSTLLTSALCALLLPTLGCNLLDVTDPENATGRGAQVFDPYQSSNSGAIRLSLQMFNRCAVLANGQVLLKNTTPMPGYPETCAPLMELPGAPPANIPPGTLSIVANTDYFLNQFTVMDTVENVHTDPSDLTDVVRWIKSESSFKNLDWSNLGQVEDEWVFYGAIPGGTQDSWQRKVLFDNANWRRVQGDKFLIEVLDAEGTVRAQQEYFRSEFLVDTPHSGHSRFGWHMENVLPPAFPGDRSVRPLPVLPGAQPEPPVFRTFARMDFVGSTNPFKTFRVPDLRGDGALRVTWTQMPDDPFYFPVTFVSQQDLPATCSDSAGNPVQCGFGIDPHLRFVPPGPEGFYKPGDTLSAFVDLRDDQGNRLHPPDTLPSGFEVSHNQANGLFYGAIPILSRTLEVDSLPMATVVGPLHNLRTRSNPNDPSPFLADVTSYAFIDEASTMPLVATQYTSKWSTRYMRPLPEDAESGTYVALVKFHRYFGGERVAKLKPYFFQVGTPERTVYPGRVGNCQICHRGVLSLDNLRHGLSVDHVESCKACHSYETERGGRFPVFIHKIHSRSSRYPAARNDCTMCHLTRESATRPSLDLCMTCHPSAHGDEFFASKFVNGVEPSRFGNCAQSCHGDTPPQLHILPEN